MTTDKQELGLVIGMPVRIGWWICEARRRDAFIDIAFRFSRAHVEHVFVVDQAANDRWALYVDDDSAECLGPVAVDGDRVTLIDHGPALARARAMEKASVA